MRHEVFNWRGEPIPDIRQWCRDRNDDWVEYHYHQVHWLPSGPQHEDWDSGMPALFYDHMRTGGNSGTYTELSRGKLGN